MIMLLKVLFIKRLLTRKFIGYWLLVILLFELNKGKHYDNRILGLNL